MPDSFFLGAWKLEPLSGSVFGPDGQCQHLEPKLMDVIVCLAQHRGVVVTRVQLLETVWAGSVNSDELLTRAISELRRVFDDDSGDPEIIETIPKRGYRLIEGVRPVDADYDKNLEAARSGVFPLKGKFVAVASVLSLLAYIGLENFANQSPHDEIPIGDRSIAVLPFVNMSADPSIEFFSDGISEDILNLLARVPDLKVIGRTSSFAFKGKNEDLRTIGQTLGVETLLEGSVRKDGNRVRIVAQLIEVKDGTHIWSETYDRDLNDVFAVQDEVASAVIDAMKIHVTESPQRGRPTDDWEAYNTFLKARLATNRLEWREAATLLEKAVQLDPKFAEAHELLAYSYWYAAYNGIDAETAQRQGYKAASAAIAINPDLIFAQLIYRSGNVGSSSILRDLDAGEWAYQNQSNNPRVLDSLGYSLAYAGYKKEALDIAERYAKIDPLSLDANLDLFAALYSAGRVEEAWRTLEIINQIGLGPSNWQWVIAGTKLAEGDDEAAIRYIETYLHQYGYAESDWVRELVIAGRDPNSGQAYLDRRIPQIATLLSEDDNVDSPLGLIDLYAYFGFVDRYYELILAPNPTFGVWSDADEQIWLVHVFRRLGLTAHPDYLRFAADMGIVDIWNQRGPPDFCRASGSSWTCE